MESPHYLQGRCFVKSFTEVERWGILGAIFTSVLFTSLDNSSKRDFYSSFADQDLKPREVKLSLNILVFYPISGTERILDSRPKPRSPRLCIALDVTASYKSRATALLTKREE